MPRDLVGQFDLDDLAHLESAATAATELLSSCAAGTVTEWMTARHGDALEKRREVVITSIGRQPWREISDSLFSPHVPARGRHDLYLAVGRVLVSADDLIGQVDPGR